MLAKSSVLALFLPFASALYVSVPTPVRVGVPITLGVTTTQGDPPYIDLLLCVSDGSVYIPLASNVPVGYPMEVQIPEDVSQSPDYFVAAIEVGNRGIIYSKSNLFKVTKPGMHRARKALEGFKMG